MITHSHANVNSLDGNTSDQSTNSNSHSHSQNEFLYYSILSVLLLSIIVVFTLLKFFLDRVRKIYPRTEVNNFIDFVCSCNSLRAPPLS